MEKNLNLKQIQEFFSKPLEENTWPEELTSRYSDEYRFELEKVTPTYQDKPGRAKYRVIDIESGELKGTPVFGSISSLQAFADDLIKPQGGTQSTNLGEMDFNDPVLMKIRAAKTKLAKMRAANAGDDGNDKFFDNAKKIAFLKKERAQLMRDMEQEAEPEGGPIADEYGSKLNRIDAAIAKLSGRKEMTYDQAIAEAKVDYDFSERELIRVLRQLKRGASTEIDMIKAFTKALGRDITKDELFSEAINEYDVYMPSQEEVDKFFALTQNETHYLNSKPVMGQEGTFNLMPIEPWDEYDLSNWNSLVRKAKQRGKSIDENKILKQAKLSSAEYQKAKKLKDFNKDDYKWNPGESLYVKLNESIAQTLAETIKLGEGVIEEELCPKGKAYIKRRKAAGEKSSAYLSGRAVKVCKGQMSGRKKKKKK